LVPETAADLYHAIGGGIERLGSALHGLRGRQRAAGLIFGSHKATPDYGIAKSWLSVQETAAFLEVSESWVRRHLHEFTRLGRLVRIDSSLRLRRFRGKQSMGNRLKPERMVPVGFKRYQRGSVSKRGSKGSQMWYGVCRPGVSYLTSRTVTSRQRDARSHCGNTDAALQELKNGIAYLCYF